MVFAERQQADEVVGPTVVRGPFLVPNIRIGLKTRLPGGMVRLFFYGSFLVFVRPGLAKDSFVFGSRTESHTWAAKGRH